MTRKEKYRRALLAVLFLAGIFALVFTLEQVQNQVPTETKGEQGISTPRDPVTEHPLLTVGESTEAFAENGRKTVMVCGAPVGIYLETDGVLIVGMADSDSDSLPLTGAGVSALKTGDYITEVNGKKLSGKKELVAAVQNSGGNPLRLQIRRNQKTWEVKAAPERGEDGIWRLGIWVRDNIQGIGTLTYVEKNGNFGALGHGISDVDTGEMLIPSGGDLYRTQIVSVVRGKEGSPGQLQGVIHYQEECKIGKITGNSNRGIKGRINLSQISSLPLTTVEIGHREEVKKGPASILACVDGTVKAYDARILEVEDCEKNSNKNFVIEITDPELIAATGGIVQGNSGSPILQNGRLVGAVTHVFVEHPTKGYGIFIENMLDVR